MTAELIIRDTIIILNQAGSYVLKMELISP